MVLITAISIELRDIGDLQKVEETARRNSHFFYVYVSVYFLQKLSGVLSNGSYEHVRALWAIYFHAIHYTRACRVKDNSLNNHINQNELPW